MFDARLPLVGTQKIAAPTYVLTAESGHVFDPLVRRIIREQAVRSVCDFGGGANPVLSLEEIAQMGLRYLVIDASEAELRKTPSGYETRQLDLADPGFELMDAPFDLVVSRFVAEHVADPAAFHTHARGVLRPGGHAAHFFPTLPSPPFVANRLLTSLASRRLINLLQADSRNREGRAGKFQAYYRWCVGPTRRQYRRFASVGFVVEEYVVHVGHHYYLRIPRIQRMSDSLSRLLIRRPWPGLATYAAVVLRQSP